MIRSWDKEHLLGAGGLALLVWGCWMGLMDTPPESYMQEVQRIFFIHVPTAWNALLIATVAFVIAIVALVRRTPRSDAALEASVEVTVLLTVMLLIQGSIWAKPTWGTWWDWDPRLTTTAIMALAFAGVLSLRSFLEQFDRRVVWSSIATIIAFVDVPIVYFCVKWWRSLHQTFSTPATVSPDYHLPLRVNAFAILAIAVWLIIRRARLALARDAHRADRQAPPSRVTSLVAGDA